ncbi:hypothetical protein RIF29_33132 [Crotalaria pallida]|uniref:Glabrous enhancer-binding protein-like DBD domain-containing protein n=1 Tax=Crotalaria pallida TaxID=3830 RepID=A0AAN9E802_CROPI
MMAHTPTSIPKPPQPSAKDKPALKRPAKSNGPASDPKRAKKNGKASASSASASAAASDDDNDEEAEEEGAKKAGGDTRKLFQRLWSEDDEIAILKGMVEFIPNTGLDPYKHADSFYDFVKKSLHTEASSNQLKEKIRRLKKKFENNAQRGKNGEDPNFTKPFDREAFELSKKVWGNANGGVGKEVKAAKSERNVAKTPKKEGRSTSVATPTKGKLVKSEARSVDSRKDVKMDADEETDTTYAASYIMGVIRGDKGVGLLNEDMLKRGMDLIGESERKEFEGQWKELRDAEIELSIKRAELAANHAKLALEAYKSSSH